MHCAGSGLDVHARKLLGFTDNRQDAALQAGHFNDFLFVSLVRAGFLGALQDAGPQGLRSDELGPAEQRTLGFDRPDAQIRAEWLLEPTLRGFNLQEAERTLRQVLAYRVWFDQRRGWRYTNPNLEQLGMVRVEYLGLDALAADDELFADSPALLKQASRAVRAAVYRELLDHMRKGMAIRSQVLDAGVLEQLVAKSHSRLRPPWGFGSDEKPRGARWLMVAAPTRRATALRDADLVVRGGSRSGLGRTLRVTELWGGDASVREMRSKDFDELVNDLLRAGAVHGLVSEERTPFDQPGWRLNDACVVFRAGSAPAGGSAAGQNAFFRDLYENLARMLRALVHPLFGFEAREHTAQVAPDNRKFREKRFRFGEREREELAADEQQLREIGEANRFLPVLFCSPTMELGVDIATLNAVHMRNVPPTPANYAQRGGRAGRSGQAALVITYASSQSPHDQYFFRDPKAMVYGEVRAPVLDLANRDLIDSHLQAVWLSCVDEPLDPCIAELLVLDDAGRPLQPDLEAALKDQRVADEAGERIRRVLDLVADDLTPELAPWYTGRDAYADAVSAAAAARFDRAFNRWRDLFRPPPRSSATPRGEQWTTTRRRTGRSGRRRPAMRRQWTSSTCCSAAPAHSRATSTPTATSPRKGSCPGTTSRGCRSSRTSRRAGTAADARPTCSARAFSRSPSSARAASSTTRGGRTGSCARSSRSASGSRRRPTRNCPRRRCASARAAAPDTSPATCRCATPAARPLGDAEVVGGTYRIDNVATQPAEQITANDEERQRQGFDLQTTFEWATRDRALDVRRASAADEEGEIVRLAYGAGAAITRLNKGLRRRADKGVLGFLIDPVTGYWAKNDDAEEGALDPTAAPRQRVVPRVQDRKNALLFQPVGDRLSEVTLATVQHAILRGIEAVFELEEDELLAEPMPTRDVRKGFLLYEATEGGAGVLTRLVSQENSLAAVARSALRIMHLAVDGGALPESPADLADRPDAACVAACYRCLMSYYNQPDHELLDRRDDDARTLLLRLARARTAAREDPLSTNGGSLDGDDSHAGRWLAEAARRGIPAPDAEPFAAGDRSVRCVWRRHYVAALIDEADRPAGQALEDLGFEVVPFDDPAGWRAAFARLASALGLAT